MVIITGASGGIGNYLFNYYLKSDDIIGIYNKTTPKDNIEHFVKVNLQNEEEVKEFVHNRKLNNIVLINAAGVTLSAMAHKQKIEDFKCTIEINLISTFTIIRYLLPIMREQYYGRIINISSVVPQIGTPGNVAYASSKSALWGMSKVIAKENANKGITSNCLNLGYCDTGMVETIPTNILSEITEQIPLKKLCGMNNISNAIDFLINSDYVTGSEININGGIF